MKKCFTRENLLDEIALINFNQKLQTILRFKYIILINLPREIKNIRVFNNYEHNQPSTYILNSFIVFTYHEYILMQLI